MKISRRTQVAAVLTLLAVGLVGCGDDDDGDAGTIGVRLEHRVDGALLRLEEGLYTNAAGNEYSVSRLEYIITEVALEKEGGERYQLARQHYINAAAAATHRLVAEKVPAGTYTRLSFRFGIAGNEPGALPNLGHFNNMAWPEGMGGGYHYMRFEGNFQNGDSDGAFAVHTGPSRGGEYSFTVSLPIVLELSGDAWEIGVVMDLNQWLDGPNVYDFSGFGPIMGNIDAQALLQANGASVFSADEVKQVDPEELVHDHDDGQHGHEGEPEDHSGHEGEVDE